MHPISLHATTFPQEAVLKPVPSRLSVMQYIMPPALVLAPLLPHLMVVPVWCAGGGSDGNPADGRLPSAAAAAGCRESNVAALASHALGPHLSRGSPAAGSSPLYTPHRNPLC